VFCRRYILPPQLHWCATSTGGGCQNLTQMTQTTRSGSVQKPDARRPVIEIKMTHPTNSPRDSAGERRATQATAQGPTQGRRRTLLGRIPGKTYERSSIKKSPLQSQSLGEAVADVSCPQRRRCWPACMQQSAQDDKWLDA
jgi:hypothetical protein